MDISGLVGRNIDLAFGVGSALVRHCTFFKTQSGPGTGLVTQVATEAAVHGLFSGYRSGDIDGSVVRVGDEKCLVRASEMSGIYAPGLGDVLTEAATGLRWEVIAGRLDPTGSFWTFQVRRSNAEDWGALAVATGGDDRGTLEAASVFDDWDV